MSMISIAKKNQNYVCFKCDLFLYIWPLNGLVLPYSNLLHLLNDFVSYL